MPYDPNDPPKKLRKLSDKKQRQWVHVFNDALSSGANEENAHKMAWGAVKKDDAVEGLFDFSSVVEKGPFVSGVQGLMSGKQQGQTQRPSSSSGRDATQWHEIPSLPGRQVRFINGQKEVRPLQSGGKGGKGSAKMTKFGNLPASGLISELKTDKKTGELLASGSHRGKNVRVRIKPDDVGKLPEDWQAKIKELQDGGKEKQEKKQPLALDEAKYDKKTDSMNIRLRDQSGNVQEHSIPMSKLDKLPSSLQRKIKRHTVAASLSMEDMGMISACAENGVAMEQLMKFNEALLDITKEESESDSESESSVSEPKVDVSTPAGARAMALALSRIFGGWKGGCRLSPSANRTNMYHITVFCKTPSELGKRIIQLKRHLMSQGYREESEGIFRDGSKSVYQGRAYTRRKGNKPLAFMVSVEDKNR